MADATLNLPYTPTLYLTDQNGTPAASASGTMVTTGPAGTQADSGPLAAQGPPGVFGRIIPGSALASAGTYTWNIATLTVGGATYSNINGAFTVGLPRPNHRALDDILIDLTLALGDGVLSTTTGTGTTTTLVDARWALGQANEQAGAEVLFLAPASGADANPVYVTTSNQTNGTLTFTPAVTLATTAGGARYLLGGRRFPHVAKLAALRAVFLDLAPSEGTSDQVTIVGVSNQFEYAVPTEFLWIDRVYFQPRGAYATQWFPIAPTYWSYRADRLLLVLDPAFQFGGVPIRVEGRTALSLPSALGTIVNMDAGRLGRAAEAYLLLRSGDANDRARAQALYQLYRLA